MEERAAAAILDAVPRQIQAVAVVVNSGSEDLARLAARHPRLDAFQVYLDDWGRFDSLAGPVIPAFRVGPTDETGVVAHWVASWSAAGLSVPALVIDAYAEGVYGGTGRAGPWAALGKADFDRPYVLAGGLTPENVCRAIRTARPAGVDVASGVESAPGRKDPAKVRRFVTAALLAFKDFQCHVPSAGRAAEYC